MKIGLISDTHIPNRAKNLPEEFINWFVEEGVEMIIHCGDVTDLKIIEYLRDIAEVKVVRGNVDYHDFPKDISLNIEGWKIYVFHSSEIYPRGDIYKLYSVGKTGGYDLVIFGHTHIPLFTKVGDIFLLNPGSATGVWSGEIDNPPKSAAILELKRKGIDIKFRII